MPLGTRSDGSIIHSFVRKRAGSAQWAHSEYQLYFLLAEKFIEAGHNLTSKIESNYRAKRYLCFIEAGSRKESGRTAREPN